MCIRDSPLSDFHTYMPDMIDLMASGITSGKKKVKDALEGMTGEMSVIAKANVVSKATDVYKRQPYTQGLGAHLLGGRRRSTSVRASRTSLCRQWDAERSEAKAG